MILDFKETYILEDDFVLLRPLAEADFEHLLYYAVHESDIWQYNTGAPNSAENLKKYIENAIANRSLKKEYAFVVFDKRANKYIGSTRFYDVFLEAKCLEIGYTWYGKSFQGTGINKNCKYLLLSFAFEQLGMERVGFRANNKNTRSKNAMKSIGCVEEGVLRSFNTDPQGGRLDAVVLSILKNEWAESVKENLKAKTLQLIG